ncbi:MAG: hypothetical protein HGA36_04875 [Candidatus Moranbacteria bacterium]|nr:hypothetical protein [Candidatus Moranbacteria bacterium]
MTTSSPFQNSSKDALSGVPEQFAFRTMQEDLLTVQNTGTLPNKKAPTAGELSIAPKELSPASAAPQKEVSNMSENPFLTKMDIPLTAAPIIATPTTEVPNNLPAKEAKIIEIPTTEASSVNYDSSSTSKIIIIIIAILTIAILALGGYYFWSIRSSKQAPVQPVVEVVLPATPVVPVEEPIVITPPVEKYSTEKPNYLVLDSTTISADEIQKKLSATAAELKEKPATSLYEFTVVDLNNDPIKFSAFAAAAKLNLTPTLLSSLGEAFSLFIYNDNGDIRAGFSVATLKTDAVATELLKQEKTLPTDLSFLLLNTKPELTASEFKDGTYNADKTRYLNLSTTENLSIDYSVTVKHFILGTSKHTLRTIIDKAVLAATIEPQKEIPTETVPIKTTTTETISDQAAANLPSASTSISQ